MRSIGVDLVQPEIIRIASFSWESNMRVCALWHQAWEPYSAGTYTKAVVEVLSTLNEQPQFIRLEIFHGYCVALHFCSLHTKTGL